TTSKSSSRASRRQSPSRKIGWSSATTIRILDFDAVANPEGPFVPVLFSDIRYPSVIVEFHIVPCQMMSQCYRALHFPPTAPPPTENSSTTHVDNQILTL